MRHRAGPLLVAALALIVLGLGMARYRADTHDGGPRIVASTSADPEWDYVIPPGTGALVRAGDTPAVLPAEIEARVGESIRIVNRDDEPHLLGPWYVGPGETVRQRFASAGTYVGECNVHPSRRLRLVVT